MQIDRNAVNTFTICDNAFNILGDENMEIADDDGDEINDNRDINIIIIIGDV